MKSYITESYGTWNNKIGKSEFVFEDGEIENEPEVGDLPENPSSGVPEALKQDVNFKARLVEAAERGEEYLYYSGNVYRIQKDSMDLKITAENPEANKEFKAYFACLGGKLMECVATNAGIFLREAQTNSNEPATLSDDETDGGGEEIEVFLTKNVDGTDSDKIAVASKVLKGKYLTPARGGSEYSLLKSVIDNLNIPSRRRVVELNCDTDLLGTVSSTLYSAIKGAGTDEDACIQALEALNNSSDPGNNMLAMLYMWDNNLFGIKKSVADAELPILGGWSGAVLGLAAVAFSGGTLAPALAAGGTYGAAAIKFTRDTPIYDSSDDTELKSDHRGLLMDIMEDNEDSWDSEQESIGKLLNSLLNSMPENNTCYRMVDAATGNLIYTTGDTSYFDDNPKKKWMMTPKGAKAKYKQVFGSLAADPEFEGY